jgi:hypothetical protein
VIPPLLYKSWQTGPTTNKFYSFGHLILLKHVKKNLDTGKEYLVQHYSFLPLQFVNRTHTTHPYLLASDYIQVKLVSMINRWPTAHLSTLLMSREKAWRALSVGIGKTFSAFRSLRVAPLQMTSCCHCCAIACHLGIDHLHVAQN